MEQEPHKLYARDEICRMFAAALIKKAAAARRLERGQIRRRSYQRRKRLRTGSFLATPRRARHLRFLSGRFRLPDAGVDQSFDRDARVRQMCGELADEIEQITYEPEAVIAKHGKLKARLKAILAVQTCLTYREETERVVAEEEEAKRLSRIKKPFRNKFIETESRPDKFQSDLARSIFQKVSGKQTEKSSAQPSLF